jgi:APA family basic amino acid/polyamine antiporter
MNIHLAAESGGFLTGQFAARKSIEKLVAESELSEFRLDRSLGFWSLIAIGVGAIIGAGIYSFTAMVSVGEHYALRSPLQQSFLDVLARILHDGQSASMVHSSPPAGPAIVFALLLPCISCLLIGFCYAELACLMPVGGSVYTYSYAALGELTAWMTGWILMLEYALGNVTVATSLSGELRARLADFHIVLSDRWSHPVWSEGKWTGSSFNAPAFLLVMLVTLTLSLGVRAFSRVNMSMVILKSGVIVFFVIVGSFLVQPGNWHPFAPGGTEGILSAGILLFYLFLGFECVSVAAEEARQPERDVPLAILGSVVVSGVLYMAVAAILLGVVRYTAFSDAAASKAPALYALEHFGVKPAALGIVLAGMMIGQISSLFVCQYAQTRIWYAMSRDGLLPEVFSFVHPKTRIPHWCTWIGGAGVALCAGLIDVGESADMAAQGALVAFALAAICVIYLRKSQPGRPRRFKVPWMPWLALASLAPTLVILARLSLTTWIRFLIWLGIGLTIYLLYGRHHSKLSWLAHPSKEVER